LLGFVPLANVFFRVTLALRPMEVGSQPWFITALPEPSTDTPLRVDVWERDMTEWFQEIFITSPMSWLQHHHAMVTTSQTAQVLHAFQSAGGETEASYTFTVAASERHPRSDHVLKLQECHLNTSLVHIPRFNQYPFSPPTVIFVS